jgi:fructose-1,6-bisphosphatase I
MTIIMFINNSLFLFLFVFLFFNFQEINSNSYKIKNKISFKNFIKKKSLETNFNGNDDVVKILNNIKDCSLLINKIVSLSFLESTNLLNSNINVHNEKQKKMDLLSNSIIKNSILTNKKITSFCSEEETNEKIVNLNNNKKLFFVYDPLDGSSNIESCMPTGTIFGLYQDDINFKKSTDSINKMNNMVLGGYILYSSSIHLVFYFEYNVYHFIYDEYLKDFVLYRDNFKTPEFNPLYSLNEGKINNFDFKHKLYLEKLKNEEFSSRYCGCLVADFHNILMNGGMFMYPCDVYKDKSKLRLLYEAKPLAKIIEKTGGLMTDGIIDINKKKLEKIHETTPLYFGSKKNMLDFNDFSNNYELNKDDYKNYTSKIYGC